MSAIATTGVVRDGMTSRSGIMGSSIPTILGGCRSGTGQADIRESPMTCKHCGTEIADKAIVCYRCGQATAEAQRGNRPRPPARGRAIVVTLALLVLVFAALLLGQAGTGRCRPSSAGRWRRSARSCSSWRVMRPDRRCDALRGCQNRRAVISDGCGRPPDRGGREAACSRSGVARRTICGSAGARCLAIMREYRGRRDAARPARQAARGSGPS